jgi:hypothetical protein
MIWHDGSTVDPVHRDHGAAEIGRRKMLLGLGADVRTGEDAIREGRNHVPERAALWVAIKGMMKNGKASLWDMADVADGRVKDSDVVVDVLSPCQICVGRSDLVQSRTGQNAVLWNV